MTRSVSDLIGALDALLDHALELDSEARAAWLEGLRVEQPRYAEEVEALLAAEGELDRRGFLSLPPPDLPGPGTPGMAGHTLGAYTLERPLGHGGMGTVWLARRSDGRFEGTAAVKLLNQALLNAVGIERFRREGNLLARLHHPNIARLIDAGVSATGQPYLVLEHVEGTRIDQYADERQLGPEARIRLFLGVLGAVAHAHATLVVHRDLKPSNIVVAADGTIKLLDFGIAKLLEEQGGEAEATTLTDLGGRALTPEYAAPEQVTGGTITTATDVYALGVLLYLLLAGRHPTAGSSRSAADHLQRVLDTEPPRLSAAVTESGLGPLPGDRLRRLYAGDLDNIVARALKKRPEERYPTVDALADDLRRFLNHQPVSARADSWRYRAGKFVRRNRAPVALAVLALLALCGGLAGTAFQARRAVREARLAAEQRDFAREQLSRAEAINGLNNFLLTDAAPGGALLSVGDLLTRAESLVNRERAESDANRVEMLVAIGQQYVDIEEDARAREVLTRAYLLSRTVPQPSTRARAACALGRELSRVGQLDSAEQMVQGGLAEVASRPQLATVRVRCLTDASEVARQAGSGARAIARADSARLLLSRLPPGDPGLTLQVLLNLATAYNTAGRRPEADSMFQAAYAQMRSLGRERTMTAATLLNNWALTLWRMGQPLRAEGLYRDAIRISSPDESRHWTSPVLLVNLARVLGELGHTDEALSYAERAYADSRRSGEDYATNTALLARLELYRDRGELDRAEAALAEVTPRLTRALPPGHYVFALLLSHRALLAQAQGWPDSAQALADRAVAMADSMEEGAQVLPLLIRRRSELEASRGRVDAAVRDASRAVELSRAQTPPRTPSATLGLAYLALGRALRLEGAAGPARAVLDSAVTQLGPTLGQDHPRTREAATLAAGLP